MYLRSESSKVNLIEAGKKDEGRRGRGRRERW